MRMKQRRCRASRAAVLLLAAVGLGGCASRESASSGAQPILPLVAGVGEHVTDGIGSIPCTGDDAQSRQLAVRAALQNAVTRASAAYGDAGDVSVDEAVTAHRVERYWHGEGQCFATVQAVVRTSQLSDRAETRTRDELRAAGHPVLAFAVSSYRIFEKVAVTRHPAVEVIDALQQELIDRGFDLRRSLKARDQLLAGGAEEVVAPSSAERQQIKAAALKDGVAFLVQGEIKVTDKGEQADGQYLAVVDGTLEAVDLKTEGLVGSSVEVARAKDISQSAAYTKAISGFAISAAAKLAPQMLKTWKHGGASQ